MTLLEFLSHLRSLDIELWAENGQLRFSAPANALTAEVREQIVARKPALLAFLSQTEPSGTLERPPVQRRAHNDPPPLSFSQQRLWFLDRLEPGSAAYNFPIAVRLVGALDVQLVEKIITALVRRHETFRTTFPLAGEQPIQAITPPPTKTVPVPLIDLSSEAAPAEAARAVLLEKARAPFELVRGPLLKTYLLRLSNSEHILLINTHHIISDGWSMGVLVQEILSLYHAFLRGEPSPLPELPVQYADFTAWQQQWLQGETLNAQLAYWRQQLAGDLPSLALPTDHPRPAVQSFAGARLYWQFSPSFSAELVRFSRRSGVTPFMTLLAAFKALLHRYTGQTDLLVGSPIANRTRPELEGLIGFFVNTLVMRTDLAGDPSFRELLGRVQQVAAAAYAHQDLPFERLVETLQPVRDLSRPPLIQVLFALQNAPVPEISLPGLAVFPIEVDSGATPFDLSIHIREIPDEITGYLEYNSDLFERGSIERLGEHYRTLLAGAIASPELPLSRLPLLTAAEREQLVVDWNQTARPYPSQPLHRLLEDRAAQTPQRIAVTFLDGKLRTDSLTYEALNRRANQLAHELRRRGVGPDVLVGICLERSLAMVVALLAVLKAGGAYLPLDPAYPPARLALMLDDSAAPFLLSQEKLLDRLPPSQAELLCLDRDWAVVAEQPATDLPWEGTLAQLAYVIYTSGSTGQPKGVAVTQRGVVNFLTAMQQEPGLAQHDVLLAVTTLSFDIAVLELFLPLLTGAHLVVAAEEVAADGYKLQQALAQQNISLMQATPATWQMLLAAGWPGQAGLKMLCGGEALPASLARQLQPRGASLWNMYGPTETTVWSTVCPVEEGEGPVPIGRPIGNTHCYVLDPQRQPVPIGVPGELYIGGDGLARGYLNRPLLTAERFVPDPFRDGPGARLYRTGDLVCFRADGTLHFLNRIDHQVKVRGHRIELGEIETVLEQHPAVRQAVVIVREDAPGDRRLVAYLLAEAGEETPTVSGLRRFLRRFLPDYMVISTAVFLQQFPLTANGKVNRRALPQPQTTRPELETAYRVPRTKLEQQVAAVWRDLLQVEQIGIDDNFFDLGGHSLLLVQAHIKLQGIVRQDFSLIELFRHPTVHALATYLSGANTEPRVSALREAQVEQLEAGKARLKHRLQRRQGASVEQTNTREDL